MGEIDVKVKERINSLKEEILEKLDCLISELEDITDNVSESGGLVKDITNIEVEDEVREKNELKNHLKETENKEYIVDDTVNKEEITLCEAYEFVACDFKL